ncbi:MULTISPECIES: alpha-L-rhamnosidase [unclassified Thermotoga]|uniref:alpha-L-rhamnosidase n=1 Tax=unclassified Thermotoga TaxID=2631113 RepID=UPI000280E73E|nr:MULTISPECIES: alpha-L-rhamnosidase [unclassified Thermotoga]AIY87265.1 alpha-L-rhamnosidase [Thermotoga sp. 2812B]EJX26467.1 alpha-L-rhamnosidase [Thermotoga sp. EMP]
MLRLENLRCEYMRNPINIDVEKPRFSWILISDQRDQFQRAYRIIVSSSYEKALNWIGDIWDSGKVLSGENINVEYGGKELESFTRYYWRVKCWTDNEEAESDIAFFETAALEEEDWKAKWITKKEFISFISNENPASGQDKCKQYYAAYFRKEFEITKNVKRARAYICGLGIYELRINGRKVGDNVLDPGQTDYSKIALYSTYDITDYLNEKNAIGVIVGNGRHIESYGYGKPRLIAQFLIEYEDGTREFLVTDENWRVSHGPLMENGIYYGERYDARLEMPGWDEYGFDDSSWEEVEATNRPKLKSQMMPPIKITETLKPKKMWSPKPGVYVFDFGQNFTGWVRLKVRGPRGTEIKIRYAELVDNDGTLNTSTLRSAESTDVYILKGAGEEIYEPRFTYHGFRYVEITGYPGVPTLESVEGRFVHTAVEKIGDFVCSNDLVNQIHKNIIWGQLSNLMSIPTDCPQRDERMGWLGDAQLTAEEAILNFDMAAFYTKYLMDIRLSQREDGSIPDVVPPYWKLYPADPAWGTAYITIAWYMYLYYNDKRVLEEHYDSMKKYVEFLKDNSDNYIIRNLGKYGDWCPPGSIHPKGTPLELTSTFYFYHDALLLSKIAKVLNKKIDVEKYKRLSENIKNAFNGEFLKFEKGKHIYSGCGCNKKSTNQTLCVLPIYSNIVPEEYKLEVFKSLEELVEVRSDGHLDTGIIGTRYLLEVLSDNGRFDLAYKIVTQETYPGWGYMIKEGATTLWERWEKLCNGGMNSHNHIMFGSIDAWFYKYVAGIRILEPGWKKFQVKPPINADLQFASARLIAIQGEIFVSWERLNGKFRMVVSIPANTQALVYVPLMSKKEVFESGRKVFPSENEGKICGISFVEMKDKFIVLKIGSGWYNFESF